MSTVQCSEIGTPRHCPSLQFEVTGGYIAVGSMRNNAPSSSSVTT